MSQRHSASGAAKAGNCGCGGGGKSGKPCGCGGGCGCGDQSCQECRTPAFVRPRFFAGQLLTEEDLEALTDYVAGKNRLHMRHLHGAGVVCGLEVRCHPCDRGKVIVDPGYALDCCGNDLVVPCTSELDVLAMIRQLRIDAGGGYDCGDPCASREKDKKPAPAPAPNPTIPGAVAQSLGRRAAVVNEREPEPKPKKDSRGYCLYVTYCEQGTDPVKPFVVEEPCGGGACEPTRVREGYRFELRCREDGEPPLTLQERLKQHCGDLREVLKYIFTAQATKIRTTDTIRAFALVKQEEPVRFTDDDAARFATLETTVSTLVTRFAEIDATDGEPAARPDEQELRAGLDAFASLSQLAARAQIVRASDAPLPGDTEQRLKRVRTTLESAEPLLRARLPLFERADDLVVGRAVLEEGIKWTAPALERDQILSTRARLFAEGALLTRELRLHDARGAAELRDWLIRRLEHGTHTDCRLLADVQAIRIETDNGSDDEAVARIGARLEAALQRYVISCFCSALLPPCPSCDDTSVLLACLTVEDCEVVDICNMERTFVLTWPTMRYWIPWLSELGDLFETLCCPTERKFATSFEPRPDIDAIPGDVIPGGGAQFAFQRPGRIFTQTGELVRSFALRTPVETTLRFSVQASQSTGAIARLAQVLERSIAPPVGELPMGLETTLALEGDRLAAALRTAAPRLALDDLIAQRIDEMRPRADLTTIAESIDERIASVTSSISAVKRDVKRRPTASDLADAKPVKALAKTSTELTKANARLEELNKQMAARIDELATRVQQLETTR